MAEEYDTDTRASFDGAVPVGAQSSRGRFLKKLTNLTGAGLSLSLLVGVSVWGYQLVVRDVSGIPVIRAAEGEMRIRPPDPGGQLAKNTGLSVNEVAAVGEASAPADRLVLAPRPMGLRKEDKSAAEQVVAPVQQPEPLDAAGRLDVKDKVALEVDASAAQSIGEIDALVRQVAAEGTIAQPGTAPTKPVPVSVSLQEASESSGTAVFDGPGPKFSRRPQLRPSVVPDTAVSSPANAEASPPKVEEIDAASLPIGTRLVQLGAFPSPEIARQEWEKLQVKFGDYLGGKDRVVQAASSGGRSFFRLRAYGFNDLSEARRFCSALTAEGAECIPVVTR